jgi:hypothetical protein
MAGEGHGNWRTLGGVGCECLCQLQSQPAQKAAVLLTPGLKVGAELPVHGSHQGPGVERFLNHEG